MRQTTTNETETETEKSLTKRQMSVWHLNFKEFCMQRESDVSTNEFELEST
jgi:hypothetical protein